MNRRSSGARHKEIEVRSILLIKKIKERLAAMMQKLLPKREGGATSGGQRESRANREKTHKDERETTWQEQNENEDFEKFDDFEYGAYEEAIEKVGRAKQFLYNNQIQGERMSVDFIDGYGEQFVVVMGKEEDLLSDDTFKNSRVRERFICRGKVYMAIGISRDMLVGNDDFRADYQEHYEHE